MSGDGALSARQRAFLARRRRLVAAWRWAGPLCLLALAGLLATLWFNSPLLVDPRAAMAELERGPPPAATLATSALLLPVVVLALLLVLFIVVLFVYAALANEKKYLAIIERTPDRRQDDAQDRR